jgi:membrane fusion protein
MTGRPLFRPEAIAFQQHHRQWGQASIPQPLPTAVVTWFLVAAILVVLVFLALGHYARKETVAGYLTPQSGTARIPAPQPGTIKEVHVRDGEEVEAGQPLLTIATSQIAADGTDVNAAVLDTLGAQRASLTAQIAAQTQRTASEQARLTAASAGLKTEIAELNAQIALQDRRIRLAGDFVASADQLKAKGYIADLEVKRRDMALLEQQQSLSALRQQLANRENQLNETSAALEQLPTVMAQTVQSLRNELAAVSQRMAEIDGRRAYVIRAPTAGRVTTLQATVGQFTDSRRLQLEIVPHDSALTAELFVPARAIGFVVPGQAVRILYDAFPYQTFGTHDGRVIRISQTILTGSDAAGPIALREPCYRVTVALDRQEVVAHGRRIPLGPDMLLKADIILAKRSLASWITEPLLGVRM